MSVSQEARAIYVVCMSCDFHAGDSKRQELGYQVRGDVEEATRCVTCLGHSCGNVWQWGGSAILVLVYQAILVLV